MAKIFVNNHKKQVIYANLRKFKQGETGMFYSERQMQILELLQKEKSASVHRLAKQLNISESSIRRDLMALEGIGKIHRTFGGAVLIEAGEREVSLLYRRSQNMRAKQQIAQKAVSHIRDGMMVFLDASSTVAQIIPLLDRFEDLTVITNSPQASVALAEMKIQNHCTGGRMLNNSFALVGTGAARYLENIRADILFFSSRGLSKDGVLSDSMEEEVHIRRVMLEHAEKKIFLCDRSKFGQSYPYQLCRLEELDAMISEEWQE